MKPAYLQSMTILVMALAGCSALTTTPATSSSPTPAPMGSSPSSTNSASPTPVSSSAPVGVVDLRTFDLSFSNNVNANYSRDPVTNPTMYASTALSNGKRTTTIRMTKIFTDSNNVIQSRTLQFMSIDLDVPAQGKTYVLGKNYVLDASSTSFLQYMESGNANVSWLSNDGGTLRVTSVSGQNVSVAIEGAKMVSFSNPPFSTTGTFTIDGTVSATMTGL